VRATSVVRLAGPGVHTRSAAEGEGNERDYPRKGERAEYVQECGRGRRP